MHQSFVQCSLDCANSILFMEHHWTFASFVVRCMSKLSDEFRRLCTSVDFKKCCTLLQLDLGWFNFLTVVGFSMPSVLWCCWLGGRKGTRPVKTERWCAVVVICLERGADLHMAQLMPLPLTVSCFSKIQIGFTFLVPAYLGSTGQRAVKRVCVYVCGCKWFMFIHFFLVLS